LKTYTAKPAEIKRQWHVIDASGKTLGRMATNIAGLIMGKHKPMFSPNLDTGDFVIVINAAKVRVTGNKLKQKLYYRHSGYPGGLKTISLEEMMQADPTRVIQHAVKGMLPHTRLGASMLKKLRVFAGATHPHQAQIKGTAAAEAKSDK